MYREPNDTPDNLAGEISHHYRDEANNVHFMPSGVTSSSRDKGITHSSARSEGVLKFFFLRRNFESDYSLAKRKVLIRTESIRSRGACVMREAHS